MFTIAPRARTLLFVSLCLGSPVAFSQTSCPTSLASLNGWYGLLVSGSTVATTPAPKYLAGALLFNGAGGISGSNVYSGSGASSTATGTYVANSDCTLTLTLKIGTAAAQVYSVGVAAGVATAIEAVGIETDASAVATIDLQAQNSTNTTALNFTSSSLNGTYAASCVGPLSASSDLNLVTFSNGTLSGTDPYNNGGGFATSNVPYTGTYAVNSDGTFSGSLVVLGTNFNFYGVTTAAGRDVKYMYSNVVNGAPTGGFASCSGGLAPPLTAGGAITQVNLAAADNVYAFAANGAVPTAGGFDGTSYAFSANLLGNGNSLSWNGLTFAVGGASAASAVANTTLTLPGGAFSTLSLLASSAYGPLTNQSFVVTYTDGTTTPLTQSVSDWGNPAGYPGESNAVTMAYRVMPSGAVQTGPWYIYGYTFALNAAKTVKTLTLPATRNVVVFAVDLTAGPALTAQTITFGTIAPQTVGGTVSLTATASSGLAVSFASSSAAVCTVSGSTATLIAPGTCTIAASQAGNATYAAATPVSQSFAVAGGAASFKLTPGASNVTVTSPICILFLCIGGSSASDAITLTPVNGFAGTTSFTISGVPSWISASFSPATLKGGGATTLSLNPRTSSFAHSLGTPLTITGTSGSGASAVTSTTTITLHY